MEKINALGEITADSGDAIAAAQAAYDALTDEQKALVDSAVYVKLQDAKAAYYALVGGTTAADEETTTAAAEETTTAAAEDTTTAAPDTTAAPANNDHAAQTGDAAIIVVAAMIVALGTAIVVKKVSAK